MTSEFKIGSVVRKVPPEGWGDTPEASLIGIVIEVRQGMTGNVLRIAWNDGYGTFYEHPQRLELLA